MEQPRITQRKQQGSVTIRAKGGRMQTVPVELTITETFHADGRKDCTVSVPRLRTTAIKKDA